MSAVEEIQAAIDKLTAQKAESTPGQWFLTQERQTYPRIRGNADDSAADQVAVAMAPGNADLIVTLHATFDAQLEVLGLGLRYAAFDRSALILARAINGGA